MDESQQINKQKNKKTKKKNSNLHERALRLIYRDYSSNFEELLQRDNSVTLYQKNIQAIAIMMLRLWTILHLL